MSDAANGGGGETGSAFEMALEVVVIPVSDVDRAQRFYADLGWRLDLDFDSGDGYRVIQFTPPGSACSIIFGAMVTTAPPGSVRAMHLVVADICKAYVELVRRGVDVCGPFHDPAGVFHRVGQQGHVPGANPQRKSYASYLSFADPDGNEWVVQEITARLGPDLTASDTRFTPEVVYAAMHPAHPDAGDPALRA